jgi:hypothetical protein
MDSTIIAKKNLIALIIESWISPLRCRRQPFKGTFLGGRQRHWASFLLRFSILQRLRGPLLLPSLSRGRLDERSSRSCSIRAPLWLMRQRRQQRIWWWFTAMVAVRSADAHSCYLAFSLHLLPPCARPSPWIPASYAPKTAVSQSQSILLWVSLNHRLISTPSWSINQASLWFAAIVPVLLRPKAPVHGESFTSVEVSSQVSTSQKIHGALRMCHWRMREQVWQKRVLDR